MSSDASTKNWTCLAFDDNSTVIEDAVLVPLYKWTKDTNATGKSIGARAAIYPYHANGDVLKNDELKALAPNAYAYLTRHKVLLAARDKGTGNYETWFAYGRRQGLHVPHVNALGVSVMWSGPTKPVKITNTQKPYLFVSGFVVRPLPGIDMTRLSNALNHSDVWQQVQAQGKIWAGDKPYRTLGAPLLRNLNIPY